MTASARAGATTLREVMPIPKGKLYPSVSSNEWVQPVRNGYRMACCDCGLVHDVDFRVKNGRVQLRARRNNRSTAAIRRARHARR